MVALQNLGSVVFDLEPWLDIAVSAICDDASWSLASETESESSSEHWPAPEKPVDALWQFLRKTDAEHIGISACSLNTKWTSSDEAEAKQGGNELLHQRQASRGTMTRGLKIEHDFLIVWK